MSESSKPAKYEDAAIARAATVLARATGLTGNQLAEAIEDFVENEPATPAPNLDEVLAIIGGTPPSGDGA